MGRGETQEKRNCGWEEEDTVSSSEKCLRGTLPTCRSYGSATGGRVRLPGTGSRRAHTACSVKLPVQQAPLGQWKGEGRSSRTSRSARDAGPEAQGQRRLLAASQCPVLCISPPYSEVLVSPFSVEICSWVIQTWASANSRSGDARASVPACSGLGWDRGQGTGGQGAVSRRCRPQHAHTVAVSMG